MRSSQMPVIPVTAVSDWQVSPVPIVNPIRWRLIENRAMLLLDVRFVQTDPWDGELKLRADATGMSRVLLNF